MYRISSLIWLFTRKLHTVALTCSILGVISCQSRLGDVSSSGLRDDGSSPLSNMSAATFNAIKAACDDPKGAADVGLSPAECYLIAAGSAVRESSWNANMACQAWGNDSDPCCGLTQVRRSDSAAVGLNCNPVAQDSAGYACNVLTGIRNIGCKSGGGADCARYGGKSLYAGVQKHLGSNTGVLASYVNDMQTVYNRSDLRAKFGINNASLRDWQTLFYAGGASNIPQQQSTVQGGNLGSGSGGTGSSGIGSSGIGSSGIGSNGYPYCTNGSSTGGGYGWDPAVTDPNGSHSCLVPGGSSSFSSGGSLGGAGSNGYPYCTNGSNTGGGYGWDPAVTDPNGGHSCLVAGGSSSFSSGGSSGGGGSNGYPYCTNGSNTGGGYGWDPAVTDSNGSHSCLVH